MTTHYQGPFETIVQDGEVLTLTWKPETAQMKQQDFFDTMLKFGDLAKEHGATGLLVDVRTFGFRPGPEMGAFRRDHVIPRYNAAGVTGFAFLFPTRQVPATPMQDDGSNYASDNFDTRDAAVAWLSSL